MIQLTHELSTVEVTRGSRSDSCMPNSRAQKDTNDVHTYTDVCIYIYTHIHICVYRYIHAHVNLHACLRLHRNHHSCMHAYVHRYVLIFIHAYIHTYIHQVTEAAEYFNAERVMAMGQPCHLI